jgi:hypothetical protein
VRRARRRNARSLAHAAPPFPADDAAVVATSLACVPAVLTAGSMLGNEMLCACFVTLALAHSVMPASGARSRAASGSGWRRWRRRPG